ncbi:hypothetical protein IM792_02230 [Mucilaginibacter sp. JRF]|uniref:helix-turn-helix and ligand-binding sensor domain-containing protein n=1 Tax=Mucilaginibacter sp. JRF TaxID=2780088 RepID=UPI00187E6DB0|nr:hypothetical protein [Mucilaginibacter sp. JRF]MBE9583255.1 hypothetical protein [Mucilaginibacter sp. JRF]
MKTVLKVWVFFLIIFKIQGVAYAQELQQLAMPKIQHYSRADYNAYNQNWSVAQGADGTMYFANSKGLLSYNGSQWQVNELPMRQVVRTVATDNQGRIFTGGYAEVGYWKKERFGKLIYHSYANNISHPNFKQEEIWNIAVIGDDEIIFQSLTTLYHAKNGVVKVVSTQHPFSNVKVINGQVFVLADDGLYEYKNNKLAFIAGSTALNGQAPDELIPYALDQLLAITARGDMFIYNHEQFKPFISETQSFLREHGILRALRIDENRFAFSSMHKGVIISDGFGRIIQKLDLHNGLGSNTALSLFADRDADLWVGLEGGISTVLLQAPFSQYKDSEGLLGIVYSAAVYRDVLYLATPNGLFARNITEPAQSFKRINNISDPVTSIEVLDGSLFFSSTTGMYQMEGDKLNRVSNIGVGWVIKQYTSNPDYIIQGSYHGLIVYRKQQGKWALHAMLKSAQWLPARDLDFDKHGNIWMKHLYSGIYKITLSTDMRSILKTELFNERSGLPNTGKLNIFKYNNGIRISNSKGIYMQAANGRFVPDNMLKKKLGPYFYSKRIISAYQPEWWMVMDDNSIARLKWLPNGKTEIDRFKQRNFYLLNDFEHIRKFQSNYIFCTEDGFSLYDESKMIHNPVNNAPVINEVNVLQNSVYNPVNKFDTTARPRLHYDHNNIAISWGMPMFASQKLYSYRVKAMAGHEQWSAWSAAYQKQFDNISPGSYIFQVRTDINQRVTSFSFEVLPPWYFTIWAKIAYVGALVYLGVFLYRTHKLKLAEQKKQMELDLERRMQQERKDHEHSIMLGEQQKLAQQVALNSRNLANSSLNLIEKKEFLNKVKSALAKIKEEAGAGFPVDRYNRLVKMISMQTSSDNDLQLFDESFEQVHNEFFKRLLQAYPDLAPHDLKLAAYLKMNLSTKEIAPLLKITPRGVEIKRYRLRKRLKLNSDQNLIEFMMSV